MNKIFVEARRKKYIEFNQFSPLAWITWQYMNNVS